MADSSKTKTNPSTIGQVALTIGCYHRRNNNVGSLWQVGAHWGGSVRVVGIPIVVTDTLNTAEYSVVVGRPVGQLAVHGRPFTDSGENGNWSAVSMIGRIGISTTAQHTPRYGSAGHHEGDGGVG